MSKYVDRTQCFFASHKELPNQRLISLAVRERAGTDYRQNDGLRNNRLADRMLKLQESGTSEKVDDNTGITGMARTVMGMLWEHD